MRQRFSTRTRLVSGLLTAAMVCTFLPFSAFADSGVDGLGSRKILPHNFPNATFMEYVKRFDKDNDGFLDADEREAVKEIDVNAKSITSLKGIEFFPNLEKLDCNNNRLTELDVSKNTKLTELYCMGNWQLSELDVSKNTALKILWCGSSNLSSLYLWTNTELEALDCSYSQLSYLNTNYCPNLWYLDCSHNNLKSYMDLGISNNANLKELYCGHNQLEKLLVSDNKLLEKLSCNDNKLTNLELRFNPNLKKVNASNNALTVLFLNSSSPQLTAGNVNVNGNAVPIKVGALTRTFFLKDLPVGYESGRTSNWRNGSLNGDVLKVDPDATEVLYDFDCGNGITKTFALTVEWVQDGVKIDEINFPDENFRNYVKEKCDYDNNNYLSESEQNAKRTLSVLNKNIKTLKGIEYFPKLKELYCYENELTELDLSVLPALQTLRCGENQLTELDVSVLPYLTSLGCSQNQLTTLDLSKNPYLKEVYCSGTQLKELRVDQNPQLELLNISENQLTSLDLSQNHKLKTLNVKGNNLTSLDLSPTVVSALEASDNQIDINIEETPRTFDLSTLPGFDVSKASKWVGGTVDGSTLKVDEGATQVTYTYDCGNGRSIAFTLNVKVVPDSTVTPPSGGGTGTTTPPSGGGTGTTTPPSGGGTGTTTPPSGGGTGTTTPPSGGEGTGTTTPPSGGGTGTTTPPSGGGTGTTTPPSGGGTGTTTPPSGGGTGTTTPPSGGGTGTTTPPSGGDGGGGAIVMVAGAAVAGVVGYGVYNYVSGQKLQALLPEGVAAPENRAQTALLLWNTAGRPEPAEAPAFADVADPDTAKAAQWCVEQGLMKRRLNGKFAPDSNIPAYQVLNAYRKLAG